MEAVNKLFNGQRLSRDQQLGVAGAAAVAIVALRILNAHHIHSRELFSITWDGVKAFAVIHTGLALRDRLQ